MGQKLTKILIVLIILSLWSESLELSFLVSSAALLLSFRAKLSRGIFSVVLLMVFLILIGMGGSLRFSPEPTDL